MLWYRLGLCELSGKGYIVWGTESQNCLRLVADLLRLFFSA